jgi:hypothetical protein
VSLVPTEEMGVHDVDYLYKGGWPTDAMSGYDERLACWASVSCLLLGG